MTQQSRVTTQAREGIETVKNDSGNIIHTVTTQAREGIETHILTINDIGISSNNSSP